MPTFEFTSPDGKTYEVEGPDGSTHEQAFEVLQKQLGGQQPAEPAAPTKPTLKQRLIGDDPLKEIGIGFGRLPAETANLLDMGLSIFGQAIGVGADFGMRTVGTMHGFDNKTVGLMGQKFRQDVSEPLTNPLQKLAGGIDAIMQKFGHEPKLGKGYEKSQIYEVMNKVGGLVQQGGDKVEKATGGLLTSADVDTFTQVLTLGLGAKGLEASQPRLDKLGRVTQETLPVLTDAQKAAEATKPAAPKPVVNAAKIDELIGVKPATERATANKARREDVRKAVAADPDLADYYAFKAEERVSNEARLAEERAVAEQNARTDTTSTTMEPVPPAYTSDALPDTLLVGPDKQVAGSFADNAALRDSGTLAAIENLYGKNAERLTKNERTAEIFLLADKLRKSKEANLPPATGGSKTRLAEGKTLEELRAGQSSLDSAIAKVKEGRRFDLSAEELASLRSLSSEFNKPDIKLPPKQRGVVDYEGMEKFLRDLGFDNPKEIAAGMLTRIDDARTAVQNNASGESAASLEAQSRVAGEKAAGQTRLLVDKDGTVRPLVGVDAVDQVAKPGQVILQKGVGKDTWTTLSKGADVGGAGEARAKAVAASQRGIADPKDLAKLAAVAGTATVGSQLTEDPLLGGLTAAAFTAAGLYGGAKAKTLAAEAVRGLDYAGGNVSTRIGNMSQAVLHRAREYERGVLTRTHGLLDKAHPFIERLDKVKGEKGQVLARAILTNDPVAVKTALDAVGDPKLSAEFSNVRKMLEEVGKELQTHGRVGNLRENYFPRMVKDLDGLMRQLGTETRTRLQQALNDANVESLRKTGAPLSDLEQTTIINRALTQSVDGMKGKPGFSKARQIDAITVELQPFYASPVESLHSYLSLAAKDLEKTKFFGKDLARTDGKIDLQASIGNVVKRELDAGNITFAQADELSSILRSRFGPGEASSAGLIQDVKNWINAGLLGNVVSAATQLGDVGTTAAIQGLRPTIEGVVRQLSGNRRVNMKDFGLADHISEEFVSTRKSAKFLNATFRLGLFTAVDKFGKNVSLESALSKLQNQAKTIGGMRALERKYGEAFGEDFQTLAAELRSGKVGEQTRAALFSELSDMQPITRLEVPQAYLDMPNGRAVYMLKTFMLKQFDIVRREAYNEIRHGNVVQGVKNLTRYAVALGMAGATTDMLRNWLMGREVDFDANDLSKNILKTFGWSEYVADQAKRGDVVKAVGGTLLPPYKMFDDLYKAAGGGELSNESREKARSKVVQYIPVFGKLFESHLLGGAGQRDEAEAKRKAKEAP